MPRKTKISKESICDCALNLISNEGIQALNARSLTARLGCSTQPLFTHYKSMEELKNDVYHAAYNYYLSYLKNTASDPSVPTYKSSGLAYFRFAKEKPLLFQWIFMGKRTEQEQQATGPEWGKIISLIQEKTNLPYEKAEAFHKEMWIYVHGIATMSATGFLDLDESTVSQMLSDNYRRLLEDFTRRDSDE